MNRVTTQHPYGMSNHLTLVLQHGPCKGYCQKRNSIYIISSKQNIHVKSRTIYMDILFFITFAYIKQRIKSLLKNMKHKVKVTVISIRNCRRSIAPTQKQECVHATTLVMSLFLSVTMRMIISGMVA